jgi:hypothetical protein
MFSTARIPPITVTLDPYTQTPAATEDQSVAVEPPGQQVGAREKRSLTSDRSAKGLA